MRSSRIGMVVVSFAVAVAALAWLPQFRKAATPWYPAPMDVDPGERDPQFRTRRKAWIESLHRHAPDVDWRAQDAAWRGQRMQRVQAARHETLTGGGSLQSLRQVRLAGIAGYWQERGSTNQAGRVTGGMYDAANNRLTVLSHGGNIWRADRDQLDWSSPNDSASFLSSGFLDRLGGVAGERLLLASDAPQGVFWSDDGGQSFAAASGDNLINAWSTTGLVVREEGGAEVYMARLHYDAAASAWRTHLFASQNRAENFTSLGFVGERDRVALFSPRYGSDQVFVLVDAQLKRIVSGTQTLQTVATLPLASAVVAGDRMALSGGVSGGQVFLYAMHSRPAAQRTEVYRSLDGGVSWQARTSAPTTLFGPSSGASSTRDPAVAFVGGVNLFRSLDGGMSWLPVNDWAEYYDDPEYRLHADIPKVEVWRDSAGDERVYVSTDGGLYESRDNLLTVRNLSLQGLHVSQYYTSYTQRSGQRAVLVGAQDQGYQKAVTPSGGLDHFDQVISGDYGQMTSADGGASVWMVYPNFAMLDLTPAALGQGGLRFWNFTGMQDALWMPPIAADPLQPYSALLAGGKQVVRLTYAGAISAVREPFNFGSQITALAVATSGSRYAMTSAGLLYRDSGGGWSNSAGSLPGGHYFYGNKILPDPARPGTLYVGGSGYSNPAVYVSSNDGVTFTPMSAGLPNTLVFDLAASQDGNHLFAATEVGPFYFDRDSNQWLDISGLAAPDQRYWSVDFIDQPGGGVARFATYGRGLWDLTLGEEGDRIFQHGFE